MTSSIVCKTAAEHALFLHTIQFIHSEYIENLIVEKYEVYIPGASIAVGNFSSRLGYFLCTHGFSAIEPDTIFDTKKCPRNLPGGAQLSKRGTH